MTGQQLKNSILQMAIQGKLVPQDPHDEPASVLLERIREEKKRLVKEGVLKKKDLEETPISEEEKPFDIPESWVWCRIKDVSESYIGLTYKPSDVSEKGWIVLRSSNIQNGNLDYNDIVRVNLSISDKLQVHDNDIIICARNGSQKLVGKSAIVKKVTEPMTFGAFMAICRTPFYNYISKFLLSPLFFDQLRQNSNTTTIYQLTQNNFNKYLIPLPPLSEQRRIVEKLESLMPLIESYGKSQEALNALNASLPEKLRQSILQEAIQGHLVPQDPNEEPASVLLERIRAEKARLVKDGKLKKKDLEEKPISPDEIPFDIPEGWVWCRLGDLFNIVSARRVHQKDWRTSGIPFFRTREIGWLADKKDVKTELFIDVALYEEFKKSGYPSENDIMMTAVGTVGKTYIVKATDKFYYKDASVLCLENVGKVDPQYVCHVVQSPYFKAMVAEGAGGTTVDTITIIRANEYLIPLPPLSEQRRIVTKLEELLQEIDKLEA